MRKFLMVSAVCLLPLIGSSAQAAKVMSDGEMDKVTAGTATALASAYAFGINPFVWISTTTKVGPGFSFSSSSSSSSAN